MGGQILLLLALLLGANCTRKPGSDKYPIWIFNILYIVWWWQHTDSL